MLVKNQNELVNQMRTIDENTVPPRTGSTQEGRSLERIANTLAAKAP